MVCDDSNRFNTSFVMCLNSCLRLFGDVWPNGLYDGYMKSERFVFLDEFQILQSFGKVFDDSRPLISVMNASFYRGVWRFDGEKYLAIFYIICKR